MTQRRVFSYHDLETSRQHNRRFAKVIQSGVYSGFIPSMAAGSTSKIDLSPGTFDASRALTKEGVLIIEDATIYDAVEVSQPDAVNPRWDLLVIEYQYTTNAALAATYTLISGTPSATPTQPTANDYQVPLAYVYVRADTSGSSPRVPNILDDDLYPVQRANLVNGSAEVGDLKPVIAPDTQHVYINSGSFHNADGTAVLTFEGGYSPDIDISSTSVWYYVYGITDNLTIVEIEKVSSLADVSAFSSTVMPLVIARTVAATGPTTNDAQIAELIDLRTIFYRAPALNLENDKWTDHFQNSMFLNMVPEYFEDDSGLLNLGVYDSGSTTYNTTDVAGGASTPDFTLSIDAVTTELVITYNGSGLSQEAYIILDDLLTNPSAGFTQPTHLQVIGESNLTKNLRYSYATASPTSPASFITISQKVEPPEEALPILFASPGPSNLYLRLELQAGEFSAAGETRRIGAIVSFFNIDPATGAQTSYVQDAIENAIYAPQNLIANPFILWSQNNPNTAGTQVPHDYLNDLVLTIEDAGDMGPDGWYLLNDIPGSDIVTLKRPKITAVPYEGRAIMQITATDAVTFTLEHRIPFTANLVGAGLTFSCDVLSPVASVELQLFRYGLDASQNLVATDFGVSAVHVGSEARIFVTTSDTAITPVTIEDLYIGARFFITMPAGATVTLSRPMLAIGEFDSGLPFVPPEDVVSKALGYYERVRMVYSGYADQSTLITVSAPIQRKWTEMGSLVVQEAANGPITTLSNLGALTLASSYKHIQAQARTSTIGPWAMDGDFEVILQPEIV